MRGVTRGDQGQAHNRRLRCAVEADSVGGMSRGDLERLSKDELIELVLKLQRPAKTSRTSSKPPSTDRKERREQSRPGGAKPGHEGHSRRCCMVRATDALPAALIELQAIRTEFGRPSSSMRLTATSTSVPRRSSVCERSPSPITCL